MGHDESKRPRPRRKFSDEFKRDAVDLVLKVASRGWCNNDTGRGS